MTTDDIDEWALPVQAFGVLDLDDDEEYCTRCGETGHHYYTCWSYDGMEGDR